MKNCVFCKIAEDSTSEKSRIIYQDKNCIAMFVLHPESEKHFIVFPKRHASELSKMKDISKFFGLTVMLAEKFTQEFGAKAYVLKLNNRVFLLDPDPMHVGHIHCHVIPRYVRDKKMID